MLYINLLYLSRFHFWGNKKNQDKMIRSQIIKTSLKFIILKIRNSWFWSTKIKLNVECRFFLSISHIITSHNTKNVYRNNNFIDNFFNIFLYIKAIKLTFSLSWFGYFGAVVWLSLEIHSQQRLLLFKQW